MTSRVNLLRPGTATSELRVLLRQLSLLWKFELRELAPEESTLPTEDRSLLIVDLGSAPAFYQEEVARHVKASSARSLLFATQAVTLQPALKELSGVNAVVWQGYDIDLNVSIASNDPLLHGLDGSLRLLRFNNGAVGAIETDNAAILLRADNGMNLLTRRSACYTVALPVWQFGVVSFPAWFRIMENALFFSDGVPHTAPGPYVAFRIDDLPLTGESFLKQGYAEARACGEIREIQAGHRLYGAKMEYMVSSHAMTSEGKLINATELAPKAFGLLRELYQRGEINIGAHGRAHLDVSEYRRTRKLVPYEFDALDKTETRETLKGLKQWLSEMFAKTRQGFVAPAWGYKEDVTKPEAASLFSYIADSNQHLQQSDCQDLFGTIRTGCVSLFETWRSGMSGIRMTDSDLFRAYLGAGLPIHLMLHGPFSRDPLTRGHKIVFLGFAFLFFVTLDFWLGYNFNSKLLLVSLLLQVAAILVAHGNRRNLGWWLRLAISRLGFGEPLRHLARVASQAGAEWIFLQELADHMAEYEALSVQPITVKENHSKIRLVCTSRIARPVSIHFPGAVAQIAVQPEVPILSITDSLVRLGPLAIGTYELSAAMEGRPRAGIY
ncbi:MAG: hypothetical protein WBV23_10140 [Desulfobaccales bacterium]